MISFLNWSPVGEKESDKLDKVLVSQQQRYCHYQLLMMTCDNTRKELLSVIPSQLHLVLHHRSPLLEVYIAERPERKGWVYLSVRYRDYQLL